MRVLNVQVAFTGRIGVEERGKGGEGGPRRRRKGEGKERNRL